MYTSVSLSRPTTRVVTGCRPAGRVRITETSRSPNTVSESVRGIGVAVITKMCGTSPVSRATLARMAARCSTPNRCCSSMTASERFRNTAPSKSRACVPTAIWLSPVAIRSSAARRAAAPKLPVNNSTRTSLPARNRPIDAPCCSASNSVGATIAAWPPAATAASIPYNATAVLPLPTSPCSNRFMGTTPAISPEISAHARSCSDVNTNGNRDRIRASTAAVTGTEAAFAPSRIWRFFIMTPSCRRSNSSNASRRRASRCSSISCGACMRR